MWSITHAKLEKNWDNRLGVDVDGCILSCYFTDIKNLFDLSIEFEIGKSAKIKVSTSTVATAGAKATSKKEVEILADIGSKLGFSRTAIESYQPALEWLSKDEASYSEAIIECFYRLGYLNALGLIPEIDLIEKAIVRAYAHKDVVKATFEADKANSYLKEESKVIIKALTEKDLINQALQIVKDHQPEFDRGCKDVTEDLANKAAAQAVFYNNVIPGCEKAVEREPT